MGGGGTAGAVVFLINLRLFHPSINDKNFKGQKMAITYEGERHGLFDQQLFPKYGVNYFIFKLLEEIGTKNKNIIF